MTTKIVGLDYFKTNINKLRKEGQQDKIQYLVTVHSKPVRKVTPANDTLDDTELSYYLQQGFHEVNVPMDDFLSHLEK